MKIKQLRNKNVNSFQFSINLFENDYLLKLLRLFQLEEVYLCIYGLNNASQLLNYLNRLNISFINSTDVAIRINIDELLDLFSVIKNDFDEIIVWSCYKSWEAFLDEMKDIPPFFTFQKRKILKSISFYLDFKAFDFNQVEIISDLNFNNTENVTKQDIIKALFNVN